MDELQEQQEQLITTFLEELPQAPLPTHFMERVMQQIATPTVLYPQWTPGRFRLTTMDVVLPAFATIFSVLLYWLTQQDYTQLSLALPAAIAGFEPLSFDGRWLYIGIVLAVGEMLLLLSMAWFWMEDQPILSFE